MLLLDFARDRVLVSEDEVDLLSGSTSIGTKHDGAAKVARSVFDQHAVMRNGDGLGSLVGELLRLDSLSWMSL